MHIPDALFQTHALEVSLGTAAASAALAAVALRRARTLDARRVPVLGVTAAFIFAAQMLNFPIGGPTSGHVLGAVLAAVLLGPFNAFLVMAVVLVIQCFMFGDGGVTVLGTNMFNMGVVGVFGGYAVFRLAAAVLPRTRAGFLAAVAIAAWCSVMAAAAACAVELAVTGVVDLREGMLAMLAIHALIGVGEALVTAAAVSLVLACRSDLVAGWAQPPATADVELNSEAAK
jgi:cobalt/nickel transport system permease protein